MEQLEMFDLDLFLKGPDLSGAFPEMGKHEKPLPLAFDDRCAGCKKPMEQVHAHYRTEPRPFATFQCINENCKNRLMLFEIEGERAPLFVWSFDFRHPGGETNIAGFIEYELRERQKNRERRELRETGALLPP